MRSFIKNENFIAAIILSTPFISFINSNFASLYSSLFYTLFIVFIIVIAAIFLPSIFLSFFFKKLNYAKFSLIVSFVFFIFFYFYTLLKDLLFSVTFYYNAEISLFISLIFLVLFLFFYQKNSIFKRFILIYIFVCFAFNFGTFAINSKIIWSSKITHDKIDIINEEGIEYLKKNKKRNIYYVILDGAISLDKFDKYYNTNYFLSYKPKFTKLGFDYVQNTNSAYEDTHHNFTSLFFMDYHINENNYKTYSTLNLFPHILVNKNTGDLPLIYNLKKIDYKILWFDNSLVDCEDYKIDFCSENINKPFSHNFNKSTDHIYFSADVATQFFRRSPIIPIFNSVNHLLGKAEREIFYNVRENDSLGIFMKKMNNIEFENKGYFFFIHNMLPHDPYVFNSDCTLKTKPILTSKEADLFKRRELSKIANSEGYKSQYICMLTRVNEFADFINKKDPNANVIIIGDHGTNIKDFFYLRYDIFTLVKTNEECRHNVSEILNTPNAARLLIGCTIGQTPEFIEKKNYFVNFKNGIINIGGKFRFFQEVDPNSDYSGLYK